jgi:hypothetical protein
MCKQKPQERSEASTRTTGITREVTGLLQFDRCIGIDYSGAVTPDSSCRGLWVPCFAGG